MGLLSDKVPSGGGGGPAVSLTNTAGSMTIDASAGDVFKGVVNYYSNGFSPDLLGIYKFDENERGPVVLDSPLEEDDILIIAGLIGSLKDGDGNFLTLSNVTSHGSGNVMKSHRIAAGSAGVTSIQVGSSNDLCFVYHFRGLHLTTPVATISDSPNSSTAYTNLGSTATAANIGDKVWVVGASKSQVNANPSVEGVASFTGIQNTLLNDVIYITSLQDIVWSGLGTNGDGGSVAFDVNPSDTDFSQDTTLVELQGPGSALGDAEITLSLTGLTAGQGWRGTVYLDCTSVMTPPALITPSDWVWKVHPIEYVASGDVLCIELSYDGETVFVEKAIPVNFHVEKVVTETADLDFNRHSKFALVAGMERLEFGVAPKLFNLYEADYKITATAKEGKVWTKGNFSTVYRPDGSQSGQTYLYDRSDEDFASAVALPVYSPDGKRRIAINYDDYDMHLQNVDIGANVWGAEFISSDTIRTISYRSDYGNQNARAICWSPDGNHVFILHLASDYTTYRLRKYATTEPWGLPSDITSSNHLQEFTWTGIGPVYRMIMNAAGTRIYTGTSREIGYIEMSTPEDLTTASGPTLSSYTNSTDTFNSGTWDNFLMYDFMISNDETAWMALATIQQVSDNTTRHVMIELAMPVSAQAIDEQSSFDLQAYINAYSWYTPKCLAYAERNFDGLDVGILFEQNVNAYAMSNPDRSYGAQAGEVDTRTGTYLYESYDHPWEEDPGIRINTMGNLTEEPLGSGTKYVTTLWQGHPDYHNHRVLFSKVMDASNSEPPP